MADGSPKTSPLRRFVPLGLLIAAAILFFALGGHRYLTFAALAEHRVWLTGMVERAGAWAPVAFILVYIGLVALSVPGGAFMTMTAGFLFGPWWGALYTVIGGTIGATLVFLAVRAGLAGLVARAGPRIGRFEAGFRNNALSYLLVLRLIPIFPFWLINLAAGALGMPLGPYVLGTLVGIIPATFIIASLGNGLGALIAEGRVPDLGIIFEPEIILPILGLAAISLLPVGYKWWRGRREPAWPS